MGSSTITRSSVLRFCFFSFSLCLPLSHHLEKDLLSCWCYLLVFPFSFLFRFVFQCSSSVHSSFALSFFLSFSPSSLLCATKFLPTTYVIACITFIINTSHTLRGGICISIWRLTVQCALVAFCPSCLMGVLYTQSADTDHIFQFLPLDCFQHWLLSRFFCLHVCIHRLESIEELISSSLISTMAINCENAISFSMWKKWRETVDAEYLRELPQNKISEA